jgi:16S rRNA (adenine1518-N6/adenine1519-N6)-dimethyltransferase
MSLLERTKHLLRSNRIVPNKFLGQNFMIDESTFECLSVSASLNKKDIVLDIGAGLGILTRFLADRCSRVLAVESDPRLARVLHEQLAELHNVSIVEGSILKIDVSGFNKVVSIPPYQISSRLMQWLFSRRFDSAVLILQKEFADRLVAPIGSRDYGWLTVLTCFHFEAELLDGISKTSFYPQPKVDSVIVRLVPREEPPFHIKEQESFVRLVRMLFTQRNRKIRKAILSYLKIAGLKVSADSKTIATKLPFHDRRVRDLAPEDFGELTDAFT